MFIDIDHTLNIYRISWSICQHCDVVDLQEIQSAPWQQEYTSRTVNIGKHHGGDLFPLFGIVCLQWKVSKAIGMLNDPHTTILLQDLLYRQGSLSCPNLQWGLRYTLVGFAKIIDMK